jgi:aspartyl-tRNA(Asn)/glutamyl-tRNA(Gln) amidotransferase subunit A
VADCLAELQRGLNGLRIGVIEHFYKEDAAADPDQVRGIEQAQEVLRRLGAELSPVRLSPLSLWTDCNRTIHSAEAYSIHQRDLQERPEDFALLTAQPHAAGGVRLGGEIHQGAAVARCTLPRIRRGNAGPRRGDYAVEPAAALQDR